MKKIKVLLLVLVALFSVFCLTGCDLVSTSASEKDIEATQEIGDKLAEKQPTPTDIDYSLERYNLIKRAYWVNGQREKAMSLTCGVTKPLGYIILVTDNGAILGRFIVDGKVSSLNSYLTADSIDDYVAEGGVKTIELPDVDGSYGSNDNGIFFFTTDGKYIEWTGTYLYSDIPFTVDDPVLHYEGE